MARWTPRKLGLPSQQLPQGSEDVVFKRTQDGETIAKAHSAHLANQSQVFHDRFFPIPEGRKLPIVFCDWTLSRLSTDQALKDFVKILYGTGPTLASLDVKTLIGVHQLALRYNIESLMEKLAEKIKGAKIPISELPDCISIAHERRGVYNCELKAAVNLAIRKTLKSVPGNIRITGVNKNPSQGKPIFDKKNRMFLEEFYKGGGAFSFLRATDGMGVSDFISHVFFSLSKSPFVAKQNRDLKINTGDIMDSWEISVVNQNLW